MRRAALLLGRSAAATAAATAAASPTAAATAPQLDARGAALPDAVALVLAASGAVSNTWIAEQQLPKYFPHVDRSTIRGDPIAVELASGKISFFNLAQIPDAIGQDGAPVTLFSTAQIRSALRGSLIPPTIADVLAAEGAKRGFKNLFWVYEKHLPAFATKIKPGEEGIMASSGISNFKVEPLFNAEQTEHPERFVAENCKAVDFYNVSGFSVGSSYSLYIRGHMLLHKVPRSDVSWNTARRLSAVGISVLPGAVPCTFATANGELVSLYGASMTTDPRQVEALTNEACAKRAAAAPTAGEWRGFSRPFASRAHAKKMAA